MHSTTYLDNPPYLLLHPYSASSNFLSLVPNSSLGVIHAPFGFATVSSKIIDTSRCLCDLQSTSANIGIFFISVFTMLSSTKIGVLGGGQLGRMLVGAANRLNIQMNVLDSENAPAKQISAHEGHVTGSFTDRASLRKLAEACDILTAEIEHVDTYALEEVASEIKVEPSWKTIRIIQDKFHQKEYLSKFNIPMAEYRELRRNGTEELTVIGEELGYPLMLKSKTQAYDGRGKREISSLSTFTFTPVYGLRSAIGNYRVQTEADIPSALEALKSRPLYAEKWANFRMVCSKALGFMRGNSSDLRA